MTPISNAEVQRIFFLVIAVKTKARNRIQHSSLDVIVRIRTGGLNKCYKDFTPSAKMLMALHLIRFILWVPFVPQIMTNVSKPYMYCEMKFV
jgi:hypothetical protein